VKKGMIWNKLLAAINGSTKIESILGIDYWPILSELVNYIVLAFRRSMECKDTIIIFNGWQ
jgi:hypothetical protein